MTRKKDQSKEKDGAKKAPAQKPKKAAAKAPARKGPEPPAEATHTALWIRLDIPYEQGAKFMRGVLGYRPVGNPHAPVETIVAAECESIPVTVDRLLTAAREKGIGWDASTTVVFPLDDRHMLAHYCLDEAQKHGFRFDRSISEGMKPAVEPAAAPTGAQAMTVEQARARIGELNTGAMDECRTHDMPAGMRMLRQALAIGIEKLGWAHSDTGFTLRNLSQVLRATGNDDNASDARHLLRQMAGAIKDAPPALKETDPDITTVLRHLAQESVALGDPDTADAFMKLKERLEGSA